MLQRETDTIEGLTAPRAVPAAPVEDARADAGRWPRWAPPLPLLRGFGLHILIPLFLAAGMGLAYLGAFHQPTPTGLEVGVVGSTPATQVFAQTVTDRSHGALVAHVLKSGTAAKQAIRTRSLAAVYAPGATDAVLYVSTAASATTAAAATTIFSSIAYGQHLPLDIVDVVPAAEGDGSGQGLFFLLVALSVGGYASAVVLAGVAGRLSLGWTAAFVAVTSAVLAGVGILIAGPVYGVVSAHGWLILLLAWWYVAIIELLGVGLHPLLQHWTTPVLTALFVMLNFTSSGGVFAPALQPALFAGLHSFWLGAAWLHAAQTLQYFWGQNVGWDAITMGGWSAVAVLLVLLTRLAVRRRARAASAITEEDELIAA